MILLDLGEDVRYGMGLNCLDDAKAGSLLRSGPDSVRVIDVPGSATPADEPQSLYP